MFRAAGHLLEYYNIIYLSHLIKEKNVFFFNLIKEIFFFFFKSSLKQKLHNLAYLALQILMTYFPLYQMYE